MKLLIFDTETTGLPKSREAAINAPNNWPHLVSISWVIIENNLIAKQKDYIIKPEKWNIPEDSIKIHGITNEIASTKGHRLQTVMSEFMAEQCDMMVAYNMNFDYNVIMNAIKWDLEFDFKGFNVPMKCAMLLSKSECKLPGNFGYYKTPKLKELYEFIFKRKPNEAKLHGSLYDTLILTECIQHSTWLQAALGLPVSKPTLTNGIHESRTINFNFKETN
uniref:Exonuclease domain-containing protein n=1 Tax=viral metagenome TaxID=1070528 RepID=A0A6C0EQ58_9ZZZZ